MRKLPTDRDVLRCIYEMYAADYPGPLKPDGHGENDPYLPINVHHVATQLKCKPELVFGRLYYHLDAKYRYKQDNGAIVGLFHLNFLTRGNCVHFPYLSSILATQDDEHRRETWALGVAIIALALSVAAIVAQVITAK